MPTPDGIVPNPEAYEQIMRATREVLRRERGEHPRGRWHKRGGGSGGNDHFWFTVDDRICPDDVDYYEPLAGLITTPTYTPDGYNPRQPSLNPRTDGFWLVRDVNNIMQGYDAAQVVGQIGKAEWGHPVGEPDNGFWILDFIFVLPDCSI